MNKYINTHIYILCVFSRKYMCASRMKNSITRFLLKRFLLKRDFYDGLEQEYYAIIYITLYFSFSL